MIPVLASILILGGFGFTQQSFAAPTTFFGPTPYLSTADIPAGFYAGGSPTFLEDFEDGTLDGGLVASNGFTSAPSFPAFVDSVDADDGFIDGSGTAGNAWFIGFTFLSLTFTFPSPVVEAGLVLTDGSNSIDPVTFEAFGPGMVSLGTITDPAFGDASNMGTTAEDRFFGVKDPAGIIAIKITGTKVGENEVDHVQYGGPIVPVPVDTDGDGVPDSVDPDDDDDGLLDEVDLDSITSSKDYSEVGLGGTAFGKILSVSPSVIFSISDDPPSPNDGVTLTTTGNISIKECDVNKPFKYTAGQYVLHVQVP